MGGCLALLASAVLFVVWPGVVCLVFQSVLPDPLPNLLPGVWFLLPGVFLPGVLFVVFARRVG